MTVLAQPAAADEVIDLRDEIPRGVVVPLHRNGHSPATGVPKGALDRVDLVQGSLALKRPLPALDDPLEAEASPNTPHSATKTAVIVARALLEVLSGWRPASQLSRWTSYELQQDLERRAPRRPKGARLQLRRVRVSEPASGIVEVIALADDPVQQRVRVIALRLEDRRGDWIVTRLQAG